MRVLRLMMRIYYLVLTVALTSALCNVASSTLLQSQPNWRLAYSAMQALERGGIPAFRGNNVHVGGSGNPREHEAEVV